MLLSSFIIILGCYSHAYNMSCSDDGDVDGSNSSRFVFLALEFNNKSIFCFFFFFFIIVFSYYRCWKFTLEFPHMSLLLQSYSLACGGSSSYSSHAKVKLFVQINLMRAHSVTNGPAASHITDAHPRSSFGNCNCLRGHVQQSTSSSFRVYYDYVLF